MDNKSIFAKNLKRQMELSGKTRRDVCEALGFSYYTFSDWVNGKKYPRMDKVELLANYFGVLKSDLIEEKMSEDKEKDNDTITNAIVRMRTDSNFLSILDALVKDEEFLAAVNSLHALEHEKLTSVNEMLKAFAK